MAAWLVFGYSCVRLVVDVDRLEGGLVELVLFLLVGGFGGSAAELLSVGIGFTRSAG